MGRLDTPRGLGDGWSRRTCHSAIRLEHVGRSLRAPSFLPKKGTAEAAQLLERKLRAKITARRAIMRCDALCGKSV